MQAVALAALLDNAKSLPPLAGNPEQAVLQLMEVGDLGHGADGVYVGVAAADFPAFANRDDAEALALAHTAAHHIEVTRFKDPQRQRALGEQHDVEREQRDRIHLDAWASRRPNSASNFSCSPPKPPLLITSTWSPVCTCAPNPSTRASTVLARLTRPRSGATAAAKSQPSCGEFKNHVRSASASEGAS